MTKLTDRERYIRCMLGQEVDHTPFAIFWWPWGTAWKRWKAEGCPFENMEAVIAHYGCELQRYGVPINAGPCPGFGYNRLEETDEYYVWVDSWGIKRKNPRHSESMSQFLEFPVKNWDDWRKYKAEHLDPRNPQRLAQDWRKACAQWLKDGKIIRLGYFPDVGIFGSVRWLLGDEECLIAFYTEPELVADIMKTMTDVYVEVFQAVASEVQVDELHIWEDMSGRQGPLISPDHWRQFMGPCYRRLRDLADRYKIPLMSVDTDGQPDLIVPPMMEHGVNVLFPLEVAAGCDVSEFQRKYPTLGMIGGIDKRALAGGKKAIDEELARIAPAVRRGRYIPTTDHLIPDDVSWENYVYYLESLKKLVGA